MANRLTDTTICKKQKWFKKLSIEHKLAWKYLTDECNHAGVWKIDLSELLDDLGLDDFEFEEFISCCNCDFDKKTGKGIKRERIMKINDDYVWVTGFMNFQYGGKTNIIHVGNNAVISAVKLLKSLKLYDLGIKMGYFIVEADNTPSKPFKALPTPSDPLTPLQSPSKPFEPHKDKDKEKDKEEVINKDLINTKVFNTMPILKNFNGLPEIKIGAAKELVRITSRTEISDTEISDMWEVFKIQNLTGNKYYSDEDAVYSHFINWIKTQKFDHGNKSNNTKISRNSGAVQLLDEIKKDAQ